MKSTNATVRKLILNELFDLKNESADVVRGSLHYLYKNTLCPLSGARGNLTLQPV